MTQVMLFHHALGLTDGVRELAGTLAAAGHDVHLPDLYEGAHFDSVEAGVDHARTIGFDTVVERGAQAAADLPAGLVVAGISLGVLPAQYLAQTRPGIAAAVLLEACVAAAEFGGPWPDDVPVQVHGMDADPSFAGEGDLDAARELVAAAKDAELFLYPGDRHLFTDASLPGHEAEATRRLMTRVLALIDRVGRPAP